jgi:transcriptional regulator of acetoin/glycerol metabolism
LGSWERCRARDLDAGRLQAPIALETDGKLSEARDENRCLLTAAGPVIAHLRTVLGEMGYAISITDRVGRVLEVKGDRDALRLVERVGILPGGDLSEDAMGTNGIGTVIADHRPLQIMAAEHFVEGGQPLACTGAPIRDPLTGAISGVLVVMSQYKLVRPTLLASVIRCTLEIEEEMAKTFAAGSFPPN